ncbi:MAG TPA: histidine kinase [Gaiellales bacterium]|nr:histidine kinase [Gaiellales bacterium]
MIVYSAAANADRPAATAALAVGLVAVHDVFDAQIHSAGDAIFAPALGAIAFVFGRAVRARHEQALVRASAAVAGERARIARELHDAVAHSVGVMVVQAQGARALLGDGREPGVHAALEHIERAGQDALVEMRRLLGLLREDGDEPERRPGTSLRELDELLGQVRAAGLAVDITVEGDPRPLPVGVDQSAYRIVQEALTNVRRHAPGAHATVTVRYLADAVTVEVADDGAATTAPDPSPGSGHGHASMRERAALCGGTVRIGPRAGGGYAVEARLPLTGSAR